MSKAPYTVLKSCIINTPKTQLNILKPSRGIDVTSMDIFFITSVSCNAPELNFDTPLLPVYAQDLQILSLDIHSKCSYAETHWGSEYYLVTIYGAD